MIGTTVYIRRDLAERVSAAARIADSTRTEIVVMLMKRVMKEHRRLVRCWRAVQYQEKDSGGRWCRMHISPCGRDYEFLIDSRKVFKRSVSLLLAMAVEKYLDEILIPDDNKSDNYPFNNYIFMWEMIGDVVCWKFFWGMPHPPALIFPPDQT